MRERRWGLFAFARAGRRLFAFAVNRRPAGVLLE
jgi:hypothetical protein